MTETGLRRSVELFRAFCAEQTEPDRFYRLLARDSVNQLERYAQVAGAVVVDVGGGEGYFTEAFQQVGAHCVLIEPDLELITASGAPRGTVRGDGYFLPLPDKAVDISFSSNVLEHVHDPMAFLGEMIRVTREGGVIYVSFTNWLSPWGGHDISPWHYLGPKFAEERYTRRYGHAPYHVLGEGLFPLHVGQVIRMVKRRSDIEALDIMPRYYPRWCKGIVKVPGVRELASWNLLLVLRRI